METKLRFSVIWVSAGCLPDGDEPAFEADTLQECFAWTLSDEGQQYFDGVGEHNLYRFEIIDTLNS